MKSITLLLLCASMAGLATAQTSSALTVKFENLRADATASPSTSHLAALVR